MSGSSIEKRLANARDVVLASLTSLRDLTSKAESSSSSSIPIPSGELHGIILQLLQSLRHTSSTLTLLYKPPFTAAAIDQEVEKLLDQYARLVSCVIAAEGFGETGVSALIIEWSKGVQRVGMELKRYVDYLEVAIRSHLTDPLDLEASSRNEEHNITQTGLVWNEIDQLLSSLSRDELGAVSRVWETNKDLVRDAWNDFEETLETKDDEINESWDDNSANEEDDFQNEYEILERAIHANLSPEERRRAEAAKPILGLQQILHNTVPRYLPLMALTPERTYKPLLDASDVFVEAFEVAVLALQPDEEPEEIFKTISELEACSRTLATLLRDRLAASEAEEGGKAAYKSFLDRWESRLDVEMAKWAEARYSLAALAEAL